MLLGALVLLAWNPYDFLDAGFQLSFAAVGAIFLLAPRIYRMLEGYPLPGAVRGVAAVSVACGVTTAPILCLQFGTVPLYTVPANVLAEPAMPSLLAFSFAAAALHPLNAGAVPAWLAGLVRVLHRRLRARLVAAGLPYAQGRTSVALAILATGGAAYACWRWRTS